MLSTVLHPSKIVNFIQIHVEDSIIQEFVMNPITSKNEQHIAFKPIPRLSLSCAVPCREIYIFNVESKTRCPGVSFILCIVCTVPTSSIPVFAEQVCGVSHKTLKKTIMRGINMFPKVCIYVAIQHNNALLLEWIKRCLKTFRKFWKKC